MGKSGADSKVRRTKNASDEAFSEKLHGLGGGERRHPDSCILKRLRERLKINAYTNVLGGLAGTIRS